MSNELQSPILKPLTYLIYLIAAALLLLCLTGIYYSLTEPTGFKSPFGFIVVAASTGLLATLSMYILWLKNITKPIDAINRLAERVAHSDPQVAITSEHPLFGSVVQAFKSDKRTINNLMQNNPATDTDTLTTEQQITALLREIQSLQLQLACANIYNGPIHQSQALSQIVIDLAELIKIKNIDLCLMRPGKDKPYAHIYSDKTKILSNDCEMLNCNKCVGDSPFCANLPDVHQYKFPLLKEQQLYGVIVCNLPPSTTISPWQNNIVNAVVSQLSRVLAYDHNNEQTLH